MSESNKPNELVDYSTYEGSYQEGELLGEDGQAIDLDELKQAEQPPRTPILIQGAFVVFFVALGGLMYFAFQKTPPQPKPKPAPRVDKFYDNVLSRLVDTRQKEFRPTRDCWSTVSRAQAGRKKLDNAALLKECPPFKGEKIAYQGACKDEACKEIKLQKCEGTNCQDIEGVSYSDFLYALMQRYAEGYNIFYAHQKLYDPLHEKLKELQNSMDNAKGKEEPPALKDLKDKSQKKRKELRGFLDGSGFDKSSLTTPYFSLPADILYAQIIAQVKENGAGAEVKKEEEPKPRKRRRRRRRAAKPKAAAAPQMGGTLYLRRNFPTKVADVSGYKTLTQYFRLEDHADSIGVLNYTPTAFRFWLHDSMQYDLNLCAARYAKATDQNFTVSMTILNKTGYPKAEDPVKIEPAASAEMMSCLQETIRKRLVFRALPQKDASGKETTETALQFKLRVIN